MAIARNWVFPLIRMILVAVLAVALIKIAFFPDSSDETAPLLPTGEIVEPEYLMARGSIINDLNAKATVIADPAVPAIATVAGTINKINVDVGTQVTAGDVLFDIKVETPQDPVQSRDAEGNMTVTERKPLITYTPVTAPIGGVISSLNALPNQSTAIGDVSAQIAPPTYSVTGSLDAAQRYRLTNQPTEATVSIANGPAPFTCTGLRITTPLAGADQKPNAQQPGNSENSASSGSTTLTCAVPAGVLVFPGLSAELVIAGGRAENVLIAPTTAVNGSAQTGVVWATLPDGSTEERPVKLGLTDGKSVEITEGLAEGETIREFVPGAVAPNVEDCISTGNGGMACGSGAGG